MTDPRFKHQGSKGFAIAIVASLFAHVALVALYVTLSSTRPMLDLDRKITTVHLAKLGKKRDEKLLPRLDASEAVTEPIAPPPTPVAEPKAEKIAEAPKKEPSPQKVVKAPSPQKNEKASREKTSSKGHKERDGNPLDLLKKRFGKPSDEGVESGSALGSSLNQDLIDSYAAQVGELIKQNYDLPQILTLDERRRLVVWVRLKIGSHGELLKAEIMKSSGKAAFDNAVLVGVKKIPSFGAPPLQLRKVYAMEGMELEFRP